MSILFTWSDSLSTGIRSIDKQHRGIVDFTNQLHYAIKASNRNEITNILNGLISYMISHFAFEEDLQKKHGYPSYESHKLKHDAFIIRISNFKKMHDAGEDIAKKLSGELILWLTSHIKKEDKDYIPYFNKPVKTGVIHKLMGKFF